MLTMRLIIVKDMMNVHLAGITGDKSSDGHILKVSIDLKTLYLVFTLLFFSCLRSNSMKKNLNSYNSFKLNIHCKNDCDLLYHFRCG